MRCGAQFTSKMEGMLNDSSNAAEGQLMAEFKSYTPPAGPTQPALLAAQAACKGLDFSVQASDTSRRRRPSN